MGIALREGHSSSFQVVIAEVGDKDSGYPEFLSRLPAADCRYGGMYYPTQAKAKQQ